MANDSDSRAPGLENIEKRLIAIEEWIMHSEQTLSQFNEVLCNIQGRIDALDSKIDRLKLVAERLSIDRDYEPPSLEDEKPPHY